LFKLPDYIMSKLNRKFLRITAITAGLVLSFIALTLTGRLFHDDDSREESQKPSVESTADDPRGRVTYEWKRLRDPSTGAIPPGIREREISFAQKLPKRTDYVGMRKGGESWTSRGPYNVGGRTRALALDITNENIILAGGVSGGMWRSTDGGASWSKMSNPQQLHSATCIVQDIRPGKEDTWYYGTGEYRGNSASGGGDAPYMGDGIFKSTDGGVTWSILASTATNNPNIFYSNFNFVWDVAVDVSNTSEDEVYAATYDAVYRSTDGGASWTPVLGNSSPNSRYSDVAVSSEGVVYAALSSGGPAGGIYRSEDGVTWTNIMPEDFPSEYKRTAIGIAPSDENVVYFLTETPGSGVTGHNFRKYTYLGGDGSGTGGAWEDRTNGLPAEGDKTGDFDSQGSYNLLVSVKPDNPDVVFIGGINLYRSTDGFASAENTSHIGGYAAYNTYSMYANHYCDLHANVFSYANSSVMYSGNDGGVSKTTDNLAEPVVWESLNNGYVTTQFYTVAIDHASNGDNVIVGGMQDNGSYFLNSSGQTASWIKEKSGDGAYCAVADGKSYYYMSSQNGDTYRYTINSSGTKTGWTKVTPTEGSDFIFVNPFVLDPNDSKIMYMAAGDRVFRNSDLTVIPEGSSHTTGIGWEELSHSVITGSVITALDISAEPADVLYIGTEYGRIYRLTSRNSHNAEIVDVWTDKGLPGNAYVSCIIIDPSNADFATAVFSNYNVKSIFHTEDGGSTWTDVSGNLEENPDGSGAGPSVRWIEIFPGADGNVYFAGTSTGLYSTNNLNGAATVWEQEGADTIGNVVVDMIDSRTTDGLVVAATHGNGIYSSHFETVSPADVYFEPNDSLSAAHGPLLSDSVYTAYIEDTTDVDWYYVSLGSAPPSSPALIVSHTAAPGFRKETGMNRTRETRTHKDGSIIHLNYISKPGYHSFMSKIHSVNAESGFDLVTDLTVPADQDYDIEVYQADGEILDYTESAAGVDEQLSFKGLTGGNYYIRIFGWEGDHSPDASYLLKPAWSLSSQQFNLIPEAPAGWSHPLILTKDSLSTTHVTEFAEGDTIWVRFSVKNEGPSNIETIFLHHGIFLADTLWSAYYSYEHAAQEIRYTLPERIGVLPAGSYTVAFKADYLNVLAETDESDNIFSHTINVTAPTGIDDHVLPASDYVLMNNYPNPFNAETAIRFQLPLNSYTSLKIYSLNGTLVKMLLSSHLPAGEFTLHWDGTNDAGNPVASGMYVYRIRAGKFSAAKKMLLLK